MKIAAEPQSGPRARFFFVSGGFVSSAQTTERLWKIAEPLAVQEGLEIVDVEYRSEQGRMVVRVYVDRHGAGVHVTLDDLARFNRGLGDLLEVQEIIGNAYTLEVSSPGVNRRLTRPEHYTRYVGRRVRVQTDEPLGGRRNFLGTLVQATETDITIAAVDGVAAEIPLTLVKRANYEHDFGAKRAPTSKRKGATSVAGKGRRA